MARWFVFTVCVLVLDVSLGLASPSMVGDGSTDPVLLQVQSLLRKHEAQLEALQKENIRLAQKSSTLEEKVTCLQEKTVSPKDPTTGSIAFHAILTQTIRDPGINHIVQFDKTVTNIGSHFNSQTGVFICPEVGVYKFSWMIYTTTNEYIYTELVRNGEVIGTSVSGDIGWASTGSASAITMLAPGDSVLVRVSRHNSGADIYSPLTMFNGHRLH